MKIFRPLHWGLLLCLTAGLAVLASQESSLQQAETLVQRHPKAALAIAEREPSAEAVKHSDYPYWQAVIAEAYGMLAMPVESLKAAESGLSVLSSTAPLSLQHRLRIARAQALDLNGSSESALDILNETMAEIETQKSSPWLLSALMVRGTVHTTLSNTAEAMADLQRAYGLAPEFSDRIDRADIAALLGNLYIALNQQDEAIRFYTEAIAHHQKTENALKLSIETYSLAQVQVRLNRLEEAQKNYDASSRFSEKIEDWQGVAFARLGMADVARLQKHYGEAIRHYRFALEWFRKVNDNLSLIAVLRGYSKAQALNGDMTSALRDIGEAVQLAESQSDQSIQVRTIETHAELLALAQQYPKAYAEQVRYQRLYEKISEERNSLATTELRVRFETDRRQHENQLLQKDVQLKAAEIAENRQKTKFLVVSAVCLVLVIALLVVFAYKQRQLHQQMSKLAQTDALTGLYNRRRLLELAELEFQRSRRYNIAFTIAIIDLDHFKKINDNYGHDGGDAVLKSFAELARLSLRQIDLIGRWGGEEFVAVLPHTTSDMALITLDRLRERIDQQAITHNGKFISVTTSIGVAQMQGDADFDHLLKRADEALYRAKKEGRNRLVIGQLQDIQTASDHDKVRQFEAL